MKAKLEEQREKEVDMMKPPYWHADFCPVKVTTDRKQSSPPQQHKMTSTTKVV